MNEKNNLRNLEFKITIVATDVDDELIEKLNRAKELTTELKELLGSIGFEQLIKEPN